MRDTSSIMLSDSEYVSSTTTSLQTPEDLSTSPSRDPEFKNVADNVSSDLLVQKASTSEPSDAEPPSSVLVESSGSEKYSDERPWPLVHSRPHSLTRSTSDVHPKGSPRLHLPPTPTGTSVDSDARFKAALDTQGGQRLLRSNTSSPAHNSAPSTPSADTNRTYSFVFTSSRQNFSLGGERLIGVVNPSIAKTPLRIGPPLQPAKSSRNPTLTPEQIKAHALGAVHAVSADSPFQPLRDRAMSTVVPIGIPVQPVLPLTPEGVEANNTRGSIDYYVNAARIGRSPTTDTPSEELALVRPAPHRRSLSYASMLQSVGENSGPASFKGGSATGSSRTEQASTTRPKRRKTKGYAKYIESDSPDYSFMTNPSTRRNQSYDSSASSTNSKASFDESITGLSCFGLIGSGTPDSLFGTGVMSVSRKPSGEQQRPILSETSSGSTIDASSASTLLASASSSHTS